MYMNPGCRNINDVDILIRKCDKKNVDTVMKNMGFLQGEYSDALQRVIPLSREKRILWASKMNNLFPYTKYANSSYINCYKVDFCFRLDVKNQNESMDFFYKELNSTGKISTPYFFLHLCCHFYKEAVNLLWVYNENDVNLIKLCDIYEYFNNVMTEQERVEAMILAENHGHSDDVFYSLHCVSEIYNVDYSAYINTLTIKDRTILDKFIGNRDQRITWKRNLYSRIFSLSNEDELQGTIPEYKLLD